MREDIIYIGTDESEKPFEILLTGISYCDSTYKISRPNSKIYCFEYVVSGSGRVICGKNSFTVSPGDVYMLEKGKDHIYYSSSDEPWVKMWFNAKGDFVSALIGAYGLSGVNHIEDAGETTKKLFEQFLENARKTRHDPELLIKNSEEIFHRIIRNIYDIYSKKPKFYSDANKLKNYIDANTDKNISIKELSALLYRSPSQTIRIFKCEFGVTPYEYMMQQKIKTAQNMLKNTGMRVKEISYRLGFCDEHYFSGYFKQRTGMSPLEYRRAEK